MPLDDFFDEVQKAKAKLGVTEGVKHTASPISPNDVRIARYIQQHHTQYGVLPSDEKIAEELSPYGITIDDIESARNNKAFNDFIKSSGLVPEELSNLSNALTPKQIATVESLLNFADPRSERQKLEELQVTSVQYNAWKKSKKFLDYLTKAAQEKFRSMDHVAYQKLMESVESGQFPAIKLYLEMRKLYTPTVNVNVDYQGVINKLVEILQRRLSPQVLAEIADEMQYALQSSTNTRLEL